mgnify:CR=1 FL=1
MIIDVPLQDENGVSIVDESGNPILAGTITIADAVTEDNFDDLIGALSASSVLDGMRLAKTLRGDFLRFEIEQPTVGGDFRVTYNRHVFHGLFQTLDTAVGAVAGTYARRGGWLLGDIIPRPGGDPQTSGSTNDPLSQTFIITEDNPSVLENPVDFVAGRDMFDTFGIVRYAALQGLGLQFQFASSAQASAFFTTAASYSVDGTSLNLAEGAAAGSAVNFFGPTGKAVSATNWTAGAGSATTHNWTLA